MFFVCGYKIQNFLILLEGKFLEYFIFIFEFINYYCILSYQYFSCYLWLDCQNWE